MVRRIALMGALALVVAVVVRISLKVKVVVQSSHTLVTEPIPIIQSQLVMEALGLVRRAIVFLPIRGNKCLINI